MWDDVCQKAFEEGKVRLAQECLLSFPDPEFCYVIEPDNSDYQLGSTILQDTTQQYSDSELVELFLSVKD